MVSRKGWVQRFSQTPLDERLGPNNFTVTYGKLNVEKEGVSVHSMLASHDAPEIPFCVEIGGN